MTLSPSMSLPISHLVTVSNVPGKGREVTLVASEAEQVSIAEDCGLAGLMRFEATFMVNKGAGRLLAVQGHISATVTQLCGVSLKPVQEEVEADVALSYTLEQRAASASAADEGEIEVHPDDEDPPEPVIDGKIDFGAVALEHLVLNLNPYPRAPGADFDAKSWQDDDEEVSQNGKVNPFAALAGLKGPSNDP